MKQFITFFILVITSLSVWGQLPAISLARPSIRAVDSIEQVNKGKITSMNGISFSVSSGYFPGSDNFKLGQPIISTRATTPIKTLLNYYYSLPDSTVRLVEYTWNVSAEEIEKLNNIFDVNAKHFSKLFAKAGSTKQEDHGTWSQKTVIWENDKSYVKQFMVTGSGTYRVRVLVSWK